MATVFYFGSFDADKVNPTMIDIESTGPNGEAGAMFLFPDGRKEFWSFGETDWSEVLFKSRCKESF